MSSALQRLRRAAAYGLLVHAVRTVAAIGLLWPLLAAFGRAAQEHFFDAATTGTRATLALELLLQGADMRWMASWAGAYALLSPLLTLTWLSALREPDPGLAALLRALRLYPRGLMLTLGGAASAALLALPGLFLLLAQPLTPAALQEPLAWIALALAILGALCALATVDLIRAALVELARLRPAVTSAMRNLAPRFFAHRVALLCLSLSIAVAGELGARALPSLAWALPAQQCAALAHTAVGGLWLALTLEWLGPRRPRLLSRP
ncbi:MAG: hypothetical protein OXT09_23020 [Myxococcales bacterium]|nr:hypothetical protein [Myxococcales bacterium]